MKNVIKTVIEYIPEFFIFYPIVIWLIAFATNSTFFTSMFMNCYWWMIFGIVLSANDILMNMCKRFL